MAKSVVSATFVVENSDVRTGLIRRGGRYSFQTGATPSDLEDEMMNELPPPNISDREKAFELARIWAVAGNPNFVITDRLWADAGSWGIVMCDLIKQVAAAYELAGQGDVTDRIKAAFDAEWDTPTGVN